MSLAVAQERHSHLGPLVILSVSIRSPRAPHTACFVYLASVLLARQDRAALIPSINHHCRHIPLFPCGLHYRPHPHAPIPVPAPVTLPRRHAASPRLVISCTEPQYYILSSFSLRYAPRVSFPSIMFVFPSSRSPFPQSRPPPLDSLLPPFVL